MKKKHLYSLLTTYLLASTGIILPSCGNANAEQHNKKTVRKVYVYKMPEIKVRVDTVNVSDENYKDITTRGAGGVFFAHSNTIALKHFQTTSNNETIKKYCDINNGLRRLNFRHEKEHARKKHLTRNTYAFSPFARAEVATVNEIMARASEIIEAVDYHATTGNQLTRHLFVDRADSAINKIPNVSIPGYINYNYTPVADVVITYALQGFLDAYNRGYYKHTIRKAYERENKPNLCYKVPFSYFTFNPDMNKWEPIWEFESNAGKCNPYQFASFSVRQKFMQTVDSVVYESTGADKFTSFFINRFSR